MRIIPKALWERILKPLWRNHQWMVIAVAWGATFVLAYAGVRKQFAASGPARSPLDAVYCAIQLFIMQDYTSGPIVSWQLDLARFLAPAVAAYTAVAAMFSIFRVELEVFRLKRVRGHVIICGLGRKGEALVRRFAERGDSVVVIEIDEENDFVEPARERGALVVIGDAADDETLRRAGATRASCLFAVCGDDSANAEIAVHARGLSAERRRRVLTCFVHVVDPRLCSLLRERELATEEAPTFRLEFFNVYHSGAAALLEEFPAFRDEDAGPGAPPHIVVVGLGYLGTSLVLQAARDWWRGHHDAGKRLRVTVVDREAERKAASLRLRHPQLEASCELVPLQAMIEHPEFQQAKFLSRSHHDGKVSAVYVCIDNDSLGLTAGLTLLQHARGRGIPIVVRMAHEPGLATLLKGTAPGGPFENLHAFTLLDRTCRPELLLGGTHEVLARSMWEERARAQSPGGSAVAWQELPEAGKEQYRRRAGRVAAELGAARCRIEPLSDWDAEQFEFTREEVERLAEAEYARSLEEAGAPASGAVPWGRLSEVEQKRHCEFVRALPRLLAKAGLQVGRAEAIQGA